MGIVETEPGQDTVDVPGQRGIASHGLLVVVHLLAVFTALLAFGMCGLIVLVLFLARRRRFSQRPCRHCRRRRTLILTGTFALAGLVMMGSGLYVHQNVSGNSPPHCSPTASADAPASVRHSPIDVAGAAVWPRTRQALTAPVSGLARAYVNERGGGMCELGSMTWAFLPSAAADSGIAIGGVVLTESETSTSASNWEALARHESRHVTQWATLTLVGGPLAMPVLYMVDDAVFPHSRNHFERDASLQDGGYHRPDDFGAQPRWVEVGAIATLIIAVVRRRLRWVSRVLLGGATAASAHHHDCCPLHSRGWFRLSIPA